MKTSFVLRPTVGAIALWAAASAVQAQTAASAPTMETVTVEASADASAEGLAKPFAGGQVATGGRVGLLGQQSNMDTPFHLTSYTNALIQDQQAKSVGEVLLNDPSVRLARGFGNFQEIYILRGQPMYSDDIAYNGLYGLLPRQYVASELFERVEVLHGASAFLNGAAPGGSNLGGSINLVPKRASNEALNRVDVGVRSGGQLSGAVDLSRRFGPDNSTGVRLNAVRRTGDTAIDRESRGLTAVGVGLDWRSRDVRLSADVGYQKDKLKAGRPNVTPAAGFIPDVPDNKTNYAQPWTYSNAEDVFGSARAEWDLNDQVTAWAAGGIKRGKEQNSLANPTMVSPSGTANTGRFDNHREDDVETGEIGLRGRFATGAVKHQVVASASWFRHEERGAWAMFSGGNFPINIYDPVASARPGTNLGSGDLSNPLRSGDTRLQSYALADTLAFYDDRVLLTLGLRHQTIEQNSFSNATGAQTGSYKESATTPVAGLVFKATPALSLYANYVEGLIKGEVAPTTANSLPVANAGQVFSPYKAKQKEIGVKWQQGGLGASAALYTMDKPVSYVQDQVFGAYGTTRYRGLELNVFGEPVKGLRVLGGVTFTDAKLKTTAGGVNQGNDAIGVPRRQLTLGGEWDVPGVQGLALNARLIHTSSQYANAANTLKVKDWTRTDLGVRYLMDIGNDRLLTLRARVDNVFDKQYWASVGGYPGSNYLVQSAPRTFVIGASVDF
ncbi:TonB-dependent receptor [Comamonas endophytica]|uniref:TonB-dependent siderophore receptor n=1 Tax=Comamonas endophytica TaxID=2949090 RepID=A0ABY6GD06_9BURK|nr:MULTISPECIES: TonB-dependent siderophore receptor [unclassified Acidovorax]MCD2512905.1 TonB-dependent siderophore receptor [Acidovorax sp. D4N7]UYG52748.1 TonB-dependent siderophore receptor [Acidovorax sp. 5MLIR]